MTVKNKIEPSILKDECNLENLLYY